MTRVTKNDDLNLAGFISFSSFFDPLLQFLNYRAGCISEFDIVLFGCAVTFRRFSVRPEKQLLTLKVRQPGMVNPDQSEALQPFHLRPVVDYLAQTIEFPLFFQDLPGLFNGSFDSKAET